MPEAWLLAIAQTGRLEISPGPVEAESTGEGFFFSDGLHNAMEFKLL
jgi:hypothetical protein